MRISRLRLRGPRGRRFEKALGDGDFAMERGSGDKGGVEISDALRENIGCRCFPAMALEWPLDVAIGTVDVAG